MDARIDMLDHLAGEARIRHITERAARRGLSRLTHQELDELIADATAERELRAQQRRMRRHERNRRRG